MRFLVDTNVFLDFFLPRENVEIADEFFRYCYYQKHEIYVTTMSIRDANYISHRFFHNDKMAREIVSKIYSMCTKVVCISADAAIESIFSNVNDFEDSLIVEAASENMCDAIVTSNIKDFKNSSVPVYSLDRINEVLGRK